MIYNVPKNMKVEETHKVCEHHKKHPDDVSYPGCTCYHSWTAKFDIPLPTYYGVSLCM
jgi:hypothetical protein